jgi:hypothetical protein
MSAGRPEGPTLDEFANKPLSEKLDFLVRAFTLGGAIPTPWSEGLAENYLRRLVIEQSARLAEETSKLTKVVDRPNRHVSRPYVGVSRSRVRRDCFGLVVLGSP